MRVSGEFGWVDGEIVGPTTVESEDGVLTAVRPWASGDPAPEGLLMPGLVNAHTHLELSFARGLVPGGQGFVGWVGGLFAIDFPEAYDFTDAIDELVGFGTAGVSDICNGPTPTEMLAARGLHGVVQREIFGLRVSVQERLMTSAQIPARQVGHIIERPSPHAVYSMYPELLKATIEAEGLGRPGSLHLAEDVAHEQFLQDGTGPFRTQMEAIGIDTSAWSPPGCRPLDSVDAGGWLGPDLLLVHGVRFTESEIARVAKAGAPLVLCPRSNLHILDELPNVPAMVDGGVRLALGTDSLASNADLDVLQEVRVLRERFPQIPLSTWLAAATSGGADALHLPIGRLKSGTAPGVLRVHPERPWAARSWAVELPHG